MAKKRKRYFSDLDEESKELYWQDQTQPWHSCLSIIHWYVDLTKIKSISNEKYKFYCNDCGHLLELSPRDITRQGRWCIFCSGKPELCSTAKDCRICRDKTIASHNQKVIECWSSKNKTSPWQVRNTSNKNFIFDCNSCGKEYNAIPSNIHRSGIMCPCCTNPRSICDRECDICFKKSFAFHYPERARLWSDKNVKTPDKVTKGTDHKYLFDCDTCGHEIEMMLSRINSGLQWCQYCSNTKKLCSDTECRTCFDNSFASFDPVKVSQWSKKNLLSPRQVKMRSDSKYLFDCGVCGHEFQCVLRAVTGDLKSWCYYCVKKRLCNDPRTCCVCFKKTFAYVADKSILQAYSKKNELRPHEIFYGTDKKVIFDCSKCERSFTTTPNNVTNTNSWCPHCSSKRNKSIERMCFNLDISGVTYILEKTIILGNRSLHWDAVCSFDDTEFFIESDGPHHFSSHGVTQVSRGKLTGDKAVKAFKDQRSRDLLKETYININNGLLFRFSYRQTNQIESLVHKMLEYVRAGKTGVVYMDTIYW